jgi:hypothetical protein
MAKNYANIKKGLTHRELTNAVRSSQVAEVWLIKQQD